MTSYTISGDRAGYLEDDPVQRLCCISKGDSSLLVVRSNLHYAKRHNHKTIPIADRNSIFTAGTMPLYHQPLLSMFRRGVNHGSAFQLLDGDMLRNHIFYSISEARLFLISRSDYEYLVSISGRLTPGAYPKFTYKRIMRCSSVLQLNLAHSKRNAPFCQNKPIKHSHTMSPPGLVLDTVVWRSVTRGSERPGHGIFMTQVLPRYQLLSSWFTLDTGKLTIVEAPDRPPRPPPPKRASIFPRWLHTTSATASVARSTP